MELFEVYDSCGNKTGIIKERGSKLEEGQYKMAVNIWFMHHGKVFVQKRADNLKVSPGKWAPTSGCAIYDEDPKEAAIRECYEELGIPLSREEFTEVMKVNTGQFLIYVFMVHKNIRAEELVLQECEVSEVSWKSIQEIEEMLNQGEFFCNVAGWNTVRKYVNFYNKV